MTAQKLAEPSEEEARRFSGVKANPSGQDAIMEPALGVRGWLRWMWRQLTSMRVALYLLCLVGIAAIPGSMLPQRGADSPKVAEWIRARPQLGGALDAVGFFDVYSSPWFSALYILLLISLVGCVLPRAVVHAKAMVAPPQATPSRLHRFDHFVSFEVAGSPAEVREQAEAELRCRGALGRGVLARFGRARTRVDGDDTAGYGLTGEVGYLRETGNLGFHVALVALVIAVAGGYLVGWRGDRIVAVGEGFSNVVSSYDTFAPGALVNTEALQPFGIRVDALDVRFEQTAQGSQFGAPRDFTVRVNTIDAPGAPPRKQELKVNAPLTFGETSVYLLGNGYAPVITVRDGQGKVLYSQPTPLLPQDNVYTSTGVVKVPAAQPKQLGFALTLLPTAVRDGAGGARSIFPDATAPGLMVEPFEGSLFPQGRPQSVFALGDGMKPIESGGSGARWWMQPGQTITLPGGRGTLSFETLPRWAGLSVRYDPGKPWALAASLVALLSMMASLLVRRRRLYVRVTPVAGLPGGRERCEVQVAMVTKGLDERAQDCVERFQQAMLSTRPAVSPGSDASAPSAGGSAPVPADEEGASRCALEPPKGGIAAGHNLDDDGSASHR